MYSVQYMYIGINTMYSVVYIHVGINLAFVKWMTRLPNFIPHQIFPLLFATTVGGIKMVTFPFHSV